MPRTSPPAVFPCRHLPSRGYHLQNSYHSRARLGCRGAEERGYGEIAQTNPSFGEDNPMVSQRYTQQIFSRPGRRVHSRTTSPRLCPSRISLPGTVTEQERVSVWGSADNIYLWPLGQFIFSARMGVRARAQKTDKNGTVSLARVEEDIGTLIGRYRVSQLGIGCDAGGIDFLSSRAENRHRFTNRALSCPRRGRIQGRNFLCRRTICIRAQAGSDAPIMLVRTSYESFREGPNFECAAN